MIYKAYNLNTILNMMLKTCVVNLCNKRNTINCFLIRYQDYLQYYMYIRPTQLIFCSTSADE